MFFFKSDATEFVSELNNQSSSKSNCASSNPAVPEHSHVNSATNDQSFVDEQTAQHRDSSNSASSEQPQANSDSNQQADANHPLQVYGPMPPGPGYVFTQSMGWLPVPQHSKASNFKDYIDLPLTDPHCLAVDTVAGEWYDCALCRCRIKVRARREHTRSRREDHKGTGRHEELAKSFNAHAKVAEKNKEGKVSCPFLQCYQHDHSLIFLMLCYHPVFIKTREEITQSL